MEAGASSCHTVFVAELNLAQFRLLLAGPRVSRLLPFVTARGYVADAASTGAEALEHMRAAPRHVLLVEIELGDMLVADLLQTVHAENLAGAVILLEDPMKSGLIVSTLARGIDGYVATPPDEDHLFRLVERQLLAQWALAQAAELDGSAQEIGRLDKQLQHERGKVTELVREIASLREEAAALRAAGAMPPRTTPSLSRPGAHLDEVALGEPGGATSAPPVSAVAATRPSRPAANPAALDAVGLSPGTIAELELDDDDDDPFDGENGDFDEDFEDAKTEMAFMVPPRPKRALPDERTSPHGWKGPKELRRPAQDTGFDQDSYTKPAEPARTKPAPPDDADADDDVLFDEGSEGGLFLDLDDSTLNTDVTPAAIRPGKGNKPRSDEDRFLIDDD